MTWLNIFNKRNREKLFTRVFQDDIGLWRVQICDPNGKALFIKSGRGFKQYSDAAKLAARIQEARYSFPGKNEKWA